MAYKFEITYDPSLNEGAGYVTIQNDRPPLAPKDKQTLLYLLFYLLYTKDGRELMRNNEPDADGNLDPAKRKNLTDAFLSIGGVSDEQLVGALLDAHIQAQLWTNAYKEGTKSDKARAEAERIYLSKMAFITWALWEDAKAHEFSMGW